MIPLLHTQAMTTTVRANDTAQLVFAYAQPMRFVIKAIYVRLTALAAGVPCDPQPTVLDRLLRFNLVIDDESAIGPLLLDGSPGNVLYVWTLASPMSLRAGGQLVVEVNAETNFGIAYEGRRVVVDAIRVDVLLDGIQIHRDYAGMEAPFG